MKTAYVLVRRRIFTICFVSCFSFIANFSDAQTNRALTFDGYSSYVDLGSISPAGNFSDGITIECWAKWNSFNPWSRLLDMGNGPGSDNILFANQDYTSNLRFEVYRDGYTQGVSSGIEMETGRWYHVAVTQNNEGHTIIYIDGKEVASDYIQTPMDIDRFNCYIGQSNWSMDGYFDGAIDEMRIWNVCRTPSEIRQNMFKPVAPNAPGLVAYYQCNETGGITVANACTNGWTTNANMWNGVTSVFSPAQFSSNTLSLDGADDYVSIGSPLSFGSSYTKEAMVYLTKDFNVPNNIISSYQSPFWIDGGKLKAGNNGPSYEVVDAGFFPTNMWVHVAVTYDAGTGELKLYRNGVLVGSSFSEFTYGGDDNYIGAWHNGAATESYLGGSIDEVRIWNTVRTQAQIQANMNKELNPSNEPDLISYYTFNQGIAAGDNSGMITVIDQKGLNDGTIFNMNLSGNSSNFMQQQGTLATLPVNFASFTAQKQEGGIALQWSTSTEVNCIAFDVQRSVDGKTWTTIATIAATGNSKYVNQYRYVDANPSEGKNYYRICERDIDGKSNYTKIVSALWGNKGAAFSVQTKTITNGLLQVQVQQPLNLQLFTQDGKMIWSKKLSAGYQAIELNGNAKGVYYLRGLDHTEKIVVQ